jgi:hypothetical protein
MNITIFTYRLMFGNWTTSVIIFFDRTGKVNICRKIVLMMFSSQWKLIKGFLSVNLSNTGAMARVKPHPCRPTFETALLYHRSNPWNIISGGLLPSHAFASRYYY